MSDLAKEFRERHIRTVEYHLKKHFDAYPEHRFHQLLSVVQGNVCEYKVDGVTILKVTGPTMDGTFLGYTYEGFKYE